ARSWTAGSRTTPTPSPPSRATGSWTFVTAASRYHPRRDRRRPRHPADPALDHPRAARDRCGARHPRPDPERPLSASAAHDVGEGPALPPLAGEGLARDDRAAEYGARERDAGARAAREAHARSRAGADGDATPNARGARG